MSLFQGSASALTSRGRTAAARAFVSARTASRVRSGERRARPRLESGSAGPGASAGLRDALAAGDARAALPLLMATYGSTVRRYCCRMLGADADGEDVSQIVFIQAFEAIGGGAEIQDVRAWLLGIARHRSLDLLKARRRASALAARVQLERAAFVDTAVQEAIRDPHARKMLDECLGEIDERSRRAVLLRFRDELSFETMSELTGDPPGALTVRVARALRRLRCRLEKRGMSSGSAVPRGA